MFRRRSIQPSRRAVLHVQAAGDPAAPSGLGDWFTERAFHFYLAGLRLPARLALATPPAVLTPLALPGRIGSESARSFAAAFADLDAACAQLRDADGIGHLIVTAQGRSALAAALWSDARSDGRPGAGADALILADPALPARPASLNIACPVLVLTSPHGSTRPVPAGLRRRRRAAATPRLGSHVTWLQLAQPDGQVFYAELGRWLGAYMYGSGQDRLL
jgi:hypothetical protein